MTEEREVWAEEEQDRIDAAAVASDPAPAPDPREFFCARTLERILNKVTIEIMEKDTVINQIVYLKSQK